VAAVAGAPLELAARIGLAMTVLQLGIGAVNDVVDAPADAGRKPGKPIPAGLVRPRSACSAAVVLFATGLVLAGTLGLAMLALSAVVVAIGLAYDLRLKGTAWSWLPFAVGIPILPIYGWLGATGGLDPAFLVLVPAAAAAGAALAIGNALVDVERDLAAGRTSVAARLGRRPAAATAAVLLAGVAVAAVGSAALDGVSGSAVGLIAAAGLVPLVASLTAVPWTGGGRSPVVREWAWRVEAVGLAVLAGAWLRAVLA